jgi:hypothetical protein
VWRRVPCRSSCGCARRWMTARSGRSAGSRAPGMPGGLDPAGPDHRAELGRAGGSGDRGAARLPSQEGAPLAAPVQRRRRRITEAQQSAIIALARSEPPGRLARNAAGELSADDERMQLARTPIVSCSGARQAVNRITPTLAAAYSGESWLTVPSPATEAMLTIAPPPSAIGGRMSCVARMTARKFRSRVCSHLAVSAAGKNGPSTPRRY